MSIHLWNIFWMIPLTTLVIILFLANRGNVQMWNVILLSLAIFIVVWMVFCMRFPGLFALLVTIYYCHVAGAFLALLSLAIDNKKLCWNVVAGCSIAAGLGTCAFVVLDLAGFVTSSL